MVYMYVSGMWLSEIENIGIDTSCAHLYCNVCLRGIIHEFGCKHHILIHYSLYTAYSMDYLNNNDIILRITPYLNAHELLNLALTCKCFGGTNNKTE